MAHQKHKHQHSRNHHVKREKVAIEALKQGFALIKHGLEVRALRADGSSELLSKSHHKEFVWDDALHALQQRQKQQPEPAVVESTPNVENTTHLKIFSDGGSRGNPGPSASGFVIMTEAPEGQEQILERGGRYLGITTNNQAEYQAVKLALESARKFNPEVINFYIDSLLVVNQLNGTFKVKSRDLWPVHAAIQELSQEFESVKFHHVYREYNTLADKEVNIILDKEAAKNVTES